ncbi:MAG: DUF308 domain-containing protein [Olsenella sp.]|nr:DUF308 domain-containing protein [Olsenella sp.]
METVGRSKAGTLIAAAAEIALGIYMFMSPAGVTTFAVSVIGWVLVVMGASMLLTALRSRSEALSQASFYYGVLGLLFGVLLVARPATFVAWIFIIAGIGIAISGLNSLRLALAIKDGTGTGSAASVAVPTLTIILGFLVVISPFSFADFAVSVAGFALIFCGVIKLFEGIRMRES